MSEDLLEKGLEAMRKESVGPEQLAEARTRVWEKLGNPSALVCAEFQSDFRDYLAGRIGSARRLLMEDHLSRCPLCRAQLNGLKSEHKPIRQPQRAAAWWPKWATLAASAAAVLLLLYLGRDRIDSLLAPTGARATVASVSGALYRVPQGTLQAGTAIGEGEMIRTGPGARAVLQLADGSAVDVNERTELFVKAAWSGQSIRLERGDIIVQAAKQRRGRLRVETRDSVASVKGTVFSVSAGLGGTVVSVLEGSVAVDQPGISTVLKPGQQAASNGARARSIQESVAWSPDAERYLELLASFANIEKGLALLPSSGLRTQSRLLQILPANTIIYGAIPNLTGTIRAAVVLAEQQSIENPVFRDWWNSGGGQELKQLIARVQAVTPLLGDEIVYAFTASAPGSKAGIPMISAEVRPGKQGELVSALNALAAEAGATMLPYYLTDSLMIASDTPDDLQLLLAQLGNGTGSPFASAIAERYQRGAGWMLGMDVASALSSAAPQREAETIGAQQIKHIFLEQRAPAGVEENEVTLTFKGPRFGIPAWLANSGSGGAAEYISGDAAFGVYLSTREPRQLFEELIGQLSTLQPSLRDNLAQAESRLGVGFASDLSGALGTESAFALEGLSVTGPAWVLTVLVNNPSTIDTSIRKLVDVINSELPPGDQDKRITIEEETADGRTWSTMRSPISPLATVTWTYDRSYMIAASERAVATRAIAAANGGSALIWSPMFRQQLPSSAGLHPSAFAWLNTKGALEGFARLVPIPAIQKAVLERDPILVVFDGTTEQIHAASRTRITGLIVDALLLGSLRLPATTQRGVTQQGNR